MFSALCYKYSARVTYRRIYYMAFRKYEFSPIWLNPQNTKPLIRTTVK